MLAAVRVGRYTSVLFVRIVRSRSVFPSIHRSRIRPLVLVVDDDVETLTSADLVLRHTLSIRVEQAPTGAVALAIVRQEPVNLALVDLRLPDMSGLDFAYRLREEHLCVPWILMSGFMDYDAALEAGKLGALRALHAPVDFVAVVKRAFQDLSRSRLWPSAPLAAHLGQPGTSAERWANLVLRACDAERDLPTLDAWCSWAAVSYSSLTEASRIIHIDPLSARDFMRLLRALFRTDGQIDGVAMELQVRDYRTRDRLLSSGGLSGRSGERVSLQEYLRIQRLVPLGHPALHSISRIATPRQTVWSRDP